MSISQDVNQVVSKNEPFSFQIEPSRLNFFLRGFVTHKIVCCREGVGTVGVSGSFEDGRLVHKITMVRVPKDAVLDLNGAEHFRVSEAVGFLGNQMKLMAENTEEFIRQMAAQHPEFVPAGVDVDTLVEKCLNYKSTDAQPS